MNKTTNKNISKALTWDDLANKYHEITGSQARTKSMDSIFEWAERKTDTFYVDKKEGTLHMIIKDKEKKK